MIKKLSTITQNLLFSFDILELLKNTPEFSVCSPTTKVPQNLIVGREGGGGLSASGNKRPPPPNLPIIK